MLETTLTTVFVPGTNLKGDMVSADWRFLLPDLELDTVACFGGPPLSTLTVLSNMSREVILVGSEHRKLRAAMTASPSQHAANVRLMATTDFSDMQIPNGNLDLVYFADRHNIRKVLGKEGLLAKLCKMVKPNGVIYLECTGFLDRFLYYRVLSNLVECGFSHRQVFWLAPPLGRMRAAVPVHDRATTNYFLTNILYSPSCKHQILRYFGVLLGKYPCAVIAQRAQAVRKNQPPAYLVSLAEKANVCLADYRWGLAAGGRYNSKKVLFMLFDQKGGKADAIVKLTRSPTFNSRLENEYSALMLLNGSRIVEPGTVPQPLFLEYHNNLAVLGQKIIHGQSFRQCTAANANCPLMGATIEWITDLGASTADTRGATPSAVADCMSQLFKQVTQIYKISSNHQDFLVKQIEAICNGESALPLVFMHGDAGTWNILATHKGRVAFLDWEAAEPQGMPLWDLFYFLKTYGSLVSRISGMQNTLKGFTQQFLTPTGLGALLIDATNTYCDRIHMDKRMVEPLFYTCWMHRALKEATRLPMASLEAGHYINLLRLNIEQQRTPTLVRLFSL